MNMWLILKSKDGSIWKISSDAFDTSTMFNDTEMLTVVEAFPKDEVTYKEVKIRMSELQNKSAKKQSLFRIKYFLVRLLYVVMFVIGFLFCAFYKG